MSTSTVIQEIFTHFDTLLANFAAAKSQAIAAVLNPAVTAGLGLFWALHGVRHWTGAIEEPMIAFVEKSIKMALVLGIAFGAAEYNSIVIQTFQDSPVALATALSGVPGAPTTLNGTAVVFDAMVSNVNSIIYSLMAQASLTAWLPVILVVPMFVVGYTLILFAVALLLLSKVATAILLGVGPLFILALLFEPTKNYFTSYMNMLIQYGLVGVLAAAANSFVLSMFQQTTQDMVKLGGSVGINEVCVMYFTGALGILVLWQVTSLASGLAGGISLSTFGLGRRVAKGATRKLRKL